MYLYDDSKYHFKVLSKRQPKNCKIILRYIISLVPSRFYQHYYLEYRIWKNEISKNILKWITKLKNLKNKHEIKNIWFSLSIIISNHNQFKKKREAEKRKDEGREAGNTVGKRESGTEGGR